MSENVKITNEQLKGDFKTFVIYTWYLLGLPPPTRVQLLIAEFMEDKEGKYPQRIIEAFRGVGKSYLCYAFVVWKLWQDPDLTFLIVSASSNRANAFSSTCQQFIELIPQLHHLKPADRNTTWTKVKWTVAGAKTSGSPSVESKGIESQLTGGRANYIISDDVEAPKNAFTVEQREKLKVLVSEYTAIKKGDEGDGKISQVLYLGTPQCEESLYNHLAETTYKCRIWPARYPHIDKIPAYKGKLCPVLEDELYTNNKLEWAPTDPKRFTEIDLSSRELEYGKAGFSLQFMLDTELSDAERYPLRTGDLVVFNPASTKGPQQLSHAKTKEATLRNLPLVGFSSDRWYKPIFVDNEYLPWERVIMSIDPSGRGGDETGYCVIKSLMGTLYVTRAGGLTGGYTEDEVLKPLAMIAKEEGVHEIVIESNFGDGMFLHLLKPIVNAIHPCVIDEVRHNVQKERRIIDTLEPLMARHKLVVSPEVIEHDYRTSYDVKDAYGKTKGAYSLFYQLTRVTSEKGALSHDDRLDALAMAVAYFSEKVARDADKEIRARVDMRRDLIIKKKLAQAHKGTVKGDTWVHDLGEIPNILGM